ncbi:MAG: hypothetical protein LBB94_10550 [Clostridiales bacterium]|jgi:protein-tyrosine phosphatase|nr:hypothetical protein [Clostridiales bacterium]
MRRFDENVSIDIHTHILPGMDDGAADEGEAKIMLKRLSEQNVDVVCLTAHYYHNKESLSTFLERRRHAYEAIKPYAAKLGVTLLLGSETSLMEELLNESEDELNELCVNNTGYLLLEPPHRCTFSRGSLNLVERLMDNMGVIPILAHIERYPVLLKERGPINDLLDMGCLTQMNLSSLGPENSAFSLRKSLWRYMRKDMIHFFGTDCHNNRIRPPEYREYINMIRKKLGADYIAHVNRRASKWLNIGVYQDADITYQQ